MLDDIVRNDIAQSIRVHRGDLGSLAAPWTGIASCLRAHPAGLALLVAEKAFRNKPAFFATLLY